MVDEVLQGISVSPSVKSLTNKVLGEITAGGNKAAPLRQRELEQLSGLAGRLWKALEERAQNPARIERVADQPTLASQSVRDGVLLGGSENVLPTDHEAGTEATTHHSVWPNNNRHFAPWDETGDVAPLSTTTSADFAQTFDFSQEHMLFLADQLDVDALPTMLDFGGHGLDEWL